jgi:predicted O-linked N-acetylglucosamine transferase (SPINDLY family)
LLRRGRASRGARAALALLSAMDDAALARQLSQAQRCHQLGQFDLARQLYLQILRTEPEHFATLCALGALASQTGQLQEATGHFTRAVAAEPANPGAHRNLGLVLRQLREYDHAIACFERAIALDAESAADHFCRAETLKDAGRIEEALAGYGAALAIEPRFGDASFARGLLLHAGARLAEAIASYDQALIAKPDHVEAHANRALCLYALGRHAEALAGYERVIALRPGIAQIYLHRGDVLKELQRPEEALASYEQALAVDPNHAEAVLRRGLVLLTLDRVEAAIASFSRALALRPHYAEAYFQRGYALRLMNRFAQAAADLRVAAALAPDLAFLPGARLEVNLQICDWNEFDCLTRQVVDGIENHRRVTHPMILTALIDSPRLQQAAARAWVAYACRADDSLGPIVPRGCAERVKIGYFSADFHEHPLSRLLVEMIELHDRSRFEVLAFSFGPNTRDALRQRMERAFDRFIDVQGSSNLEIATLARKLGLDIAVDLGGHTTHSRPGIFALRAAPVQINYLGYLGTSGAEYMDYIIADRVVVTADSEPFFSEKVIYLPGSFQVNDRKRSVADKIFSRAELGLPQSGFVFCCFNTSYKIVPATFAGWMRVLKQVPDSLLLLYASHDAVNTNLRAQAAQHEIDPRRLIFAGRLPAPEYLARYRVTDLFLDTSPYNGGTTVSDALWAGLPVVTLAGRSLASRVAASLLSALDLSELVAPTQSDYEELAIELALDAERLREVRQRLRDNGLTGSLFDTPRFAHNLETAYVAAHERRRAGLPPAPIWL